MPPKTLKSRILPFVLPLLPINRRTFDVLRNELAAIRARIFAFCLPRRRLWLRRIRRQSSLKDNLGGGGQSPLGWLELDVRFHDNQSIPWDIRRGLPFASSSVRLIYASHVLEHVDFYNDAPLILRDCQRSLEPGGKIRLVVPDVEKFIGAYLGANGLSWSSLGFQNLPDDMPTGMCLLNHVFHQKGEHLFGYDFETLKYLLVMCGFKDVTLSSFRSSIQFPLELDLGVHERYSLYVEALA